jgi:hypothetical protein
MCWTTTQLNWLLVFFTQQKTKTHDDGQTLPSFFPPTTTERFGFYNLITLPTIGKHLFQKPKQRFNRQSQYTTHIYSTKQTSNKSSKKQKWAKYF